jgi:hypothetical protein
MQGIARIKVFFSTGARIETLAPSMWPGQTAQVLVQEFPQRSFAG